MSMSFLSCQGQLQQPRLNLSPSSVFTKMVNDENEIIPTHSCATHQEMDSSARKIGHIKINVCRSFT